VEELTGASKESTTLRLDDEKYVRSSEKNQKQGSKKLDNERPRAKGPGEVTKTRRLVGRELRGSAGCIHERIRPWLFVTERRIEAVKKKEQKTLSTLLQSHRHISAVQKWRKGVIQIGGIENRCGVRLLACAIHQPLTESRTILRRE